MEKREKISSQIGLVFICFLTITTYALILIQEKNAKIAKLEASIAWQKVLITELDKKNPRTILFFPQDVSTHIDGPVSGGGAGETENYLVLPAEKGKYVLYFEEKHAPYFRGKKEGQIDLKIE